MLKHSPSYEAACRSFHWRIPEFYNFAQYLCDIQTHEGVDKWRSAVVMENAPDQIEYLSYAALDDESCRLVNALSRRGILAGEMIFICLAPSITLITVIIALGKLGAVIVPLPLAQATPEALKEIFAIVPCRTAFVEEELFPLLQQTNPHISFALYPATIKQAIAEDNETYMPEPSRADEPAFLFPLQSKNKAVILPHRSVLGNLPAVEFALDFFPRPDDRFWCGMDWLSFEGLLWGILAALHHGVPIIARADSVPIMDFLARHSVRVALVSTPQLLKLTAKADRKLLLRSMACFPTVPEEIFLAKIKKHFGVTPNGLWGTPLLGAIAAENRRLMEVAPQSVGRMAPGLAVSVVNNENRTLSADEVGAFALDKDSPSAALGYWQDNMLHLPHTEDGKIIGTEQGTCDLDGYLYPQETKNPSFDCETLEALLTCLPDISEAALLNENNNIRAFIVLEKGKRPNSERNEKLKDTIQQYHPQHLRPQHIITVRAFPHDAQGKLDKETLINYIMRLDIPDPDERLTTPCPL